MRNKRCQNGCCLGHLAIEDSQTSQTFVSSSASTSTPNHQLTTPEERSKYTLAFLEVATGHDHYLQETCNKKRSKYVELVCALRAQGWQVKLDINQPFDDWYLNYKNASEDITDRTDQSGTVKKKRVFRDVRPDIEEGEIFAGRHPIFTCIIGAVGFHLKSNYTGLQALGIDGINLNSLLLQLSSLAGYSLHNCSSSYSILDRQQRSTSTTHTAHHTTTIPPAHPPAQFMPSGVG